MSSNFLYRRWASAVIVIVAFFVGLLLQTAAQGVPQLKRPSEERVEKPPEVKKPKVKGPRALGVLRLTSSGKATLIPVAILIDGKFHDASIYKADPVPMALESGTVYEAEEAGDSKGLFTVNAALHSKNPGSANPWVGTGTYLPPGAKVAMDTRKAEDVPVGMDSSGSDEPPRLTRGNASKGAATSASPAPTAGGKTPGTGETGAASEPATPAASDRVSGADKASTSNDASGAATSDKAVTIPPPASSDNGASSSGTRDQETKSSAPEKASKDQPSSGQASQGQESQNYYRPTLRRGKPTQPAPEDDETSTTGVHVASETGSAKTATATATAEPVRLVPAVSDAGGPNPRSYKFFWKEGEEAERREQMLELAENEVRAYVNARAKNMIPAQAPAVKTGVPMHKPIAKPVKLVLENVQFRGFDVWGNNQPVMILSAEAQFPPAHGASAAPETYSITLVARTDIYGNLRKLYSGVTDKFHLDVIPRLELIDAVDADGDGRGELLFRETSDAGSGYVIYRATADKLWKMFDSLGEE